MNRILKIGMDVHSTSYTLCAMEPVLGGEDRIFANIQVTSDYRNVIQFIDKLKEKLGSSDSYSIECGYEAGCLGYSLYHQLTKAGVKCTILAPTTMLTQQGFAGSGEQIAPRKCRRRQMAAQNFCEDFAPRNEAARLCRGRGANRAAEKVAGGRWRRGISVKILLPGTKPQGFAGGGEQIAPLKKPPEADGGAELL